MEFIKVRAKEGFVLKNKKEEVLVNIEEGEVLGLDYLISLMNILQKTLKVESFMLVN